MNGFHAEEPLRPERPPPFDGTEARWQEWSFRFRAYLHLADLGEFVAAVEAEGADRNIIEMNEDSQRMARKLYYLLVAYCGGKAATILRTVEPGNGFIAWRRLATAYQPAIRARFHSMLQGLLNPSWPSGTAVRDSVLAVGSSNRRVRVTDGTKFR